MQVRPVNMTIKLWHQPPARSTRIAWLLNELDVPFEIQDKATFFNKADWQPSSPHPLKLTPFLEDGEVKIAESGAMVLYILQKYGKGRLQPAADSPLYPVFLQWLWFFEATVCTNTVTLLGHLKLLPEAERDARTAKRAGLTLEKHLQVMEAGLGDNEYLVGDSFTAADIMMARELQLIVNFTGTVSAEAHPKLFAYYARLSARPAFKAALEV